MNKLITIERIEEYCRAFDEIEGAYPDYKWEGEALFNWIKECIKTNN